MQDLTDIKIFLASILRPIVKEAIEEVQQQRQCANIDDATPYGDFRWLNSFLAGIPENTIRQMDAAGKIPGSSKIGKRKIYNKSVVQNWVSSRENNAVSTTELERAADEQISRQLAKRKGQPA